MRRFFSFALCNECPKLGAGEGCYFVPIEVHLCRTIGFVPELRVYRVSSNKYLFSPPFTVDRPRTGLRRSNAFLECRTLIRQWTESNLNKDKEINSWNMYKYKLKYDACLFTATRDYIGYCEVLGCGWIVVQPVLARDVG